MKNVDAKQVVVSFKSSPMLCCRSLTLAFALFRIKKHMSYSTSESKPNLDNYRFRVWTTLLLYNKSSFPFVTFLPYIISSLLFMHSLPSIHSSINILTILIVVPLTVYSIYLTWNLLLSQLSVVRAFCSLTIHFSVGQLTVYIQSFWINLIGSMVYCLVFAGRNGHDMFDPGQRVKISKGQLRTTIVTRYGYTN